MNSQHLNDDVTETEVDTNDLELDPDSGITDIKKDVVQMSHYTARRRIEDLKEEQRLRKNIESYDDYD